MNDDELRITRLDVPDGFLRSCIRAPALAPALSEFFQGQHRFNAWLIEVVSRLILAEREACAQHIEQTCPRDCACGDVCIFAERIRARGPEAQPTK